MDTSIKQYTRLVFDHGNLQASPKHIALLNQQPARLFQGNTPPRTTRAGYQVVLTGYANFVYEKELVGRYSGRVESLLNSLRATPRSVNALALKKSLDTYRVENDLFQADYRVYSGQVVVYNIQPVDKLQRQRDRTEKVGVYRVKKNSSGIWELAGKVRVATTQHAAVNGQSNNLTKATWLMGRHLQFAFGRDLKEYTLFHNPSVGGLGDTWESVRDKLGFTTPVAREFARLLSQTQAAGNETRWVAHSQGGLIFTEAVRFLLNGESSYALNKFRLNGIRNPDKGTLLDKQSVAFHGNANNNLRSKPLLRRAGIEVLSVVNHDYDLVPNLIGLNTLNPRKIIGSLAYINHVTGGSVQQSPHTLPQSMEAWNANMRDGPGKGRGPIQRAFNKVAGPKDSTPVEIKQNYLP